MLGILGSDHGEGYSFAFKFGRHIGKKIFSYPVFPAELKGNALIIRQCAANMSQPLIMHHTWHAANHLTPMYCIGASLRHIEIEILGGIIIFVQLTMFHQHVSSANTWSVMAKVEKDP